MKTLQVITITLLLITTLALKRGEKEKFIGEEKFRSCLIDIPLYYSTKGQDALMKAAKKYKDVEIVLVTNEKKGRAYYKFYYIESYQGTYGPSAFLVSPEDHNSKSKNRVEVFINYKPKNHTFYRAQCFRDKLEEFSYLKESLKEKK